MLASTALLHRAAQGGLLNTQACSGLSSLPEDLSMASYTLWMSPPPSLEPLSSCRLLPPWCLHSLPCLHCAPPPAWLSLCHVGLSSLLRLPVKVP